MESPCIFLGDRNSRSFGETLEEYFQPERTLYDNYNIIEEIEEIICFLEQNRKTTIFYLIEWKPRLENEHLRLLVMIIRVFQPSILNRIILINHSIDRMGCLSSAENDNFVRDITFTRLRGLCNIFTSNKIQSKFNNNNFFITTSFDYPKNRYKIKDFQPFDIIKKLDFIKITLNYTRNNILEPIKFKDSFLSRDIKNNIIPYLGVVFVEAFIFWQTKTPPDPTRIQAEMEVAKSMYNRCKQK